MKKYTSAILIAATFTIMTAGCAGRESSTAEEKPETAGTELSATAETAEAMKEEAAPAVLNIYSIGEDFVNRVKDYHPEYEAAGDDCGVIAGTQVKWHIYSDAAQYREVLDEKLASQAADNPERQADRSDDIDLFVVDESYLRDYVEDDRSLDVVKDVGLTAEDLSDQFAYTQQMATDSGGVLKAVTWQAAPGVFAYRRSIAKEVLGSDDPGKVQEAVSNWDTFAQTAELAAEAGYYMLSGFGDAYQAYADNVGSGWVENGTLNVDPHLEEWALQTREFVENGYIHGTEQYSDEWLADHSGDGRVFGFFYSSWGIHYTLQNKAEGIATDEGAEENEEVQSAAGDYAVCRGPEPCHYGGKWIVAAAGSDNLELIKSLMYTLTCDQQVMKKIATDIHEFTNTISGMKELAQTEYKVDLLGGQNPIPVYLESASELSQKHTGSYDDDLDLGFQVSMQDYFDGKVSKDDALEIFKKTALSRYEELRPEEETEEENEEEKKE